MCAVVTFGCSSGMVATYQQRNEDAVAAFTSALSFDSSSLSARANRANCLLDLERYTEANQDASVCVRKEPCCEYFLLRSRARLGLRQLKNGLKDAEQALRLDPNCIQAHLVSARFHVALGDLDHALADCDAGLAIEPGNDGLRNFRASISDTVCSNHSTNSMLLILISCVSLNTSIRSLARSAVGSERRPRSGISRTKAS